MAIAISFWLDKKLEAAIRKLWSELAHREISSMLHTGPYRPHMTVGIWEEAVFPDLANSLQQFSTTQKNIPISFGSVGLFPGDEGIAFLQPTISPELLRLHSLIHITIRDFALVPNNHYLPNSWNPHCTMAWQVTRQKALEACEYLLTNALPLEGTIEAIGIIETPTF